MFAGGSYAEVRRWFLAFVNSHAKRESPRTEAMLEGGEERIEKSFGLRLRLGERYHPPRDQPPIEFAFLEVSAGKGNFSWCESLGKHVRGWAGELLEAEGGRASKSA